MSFFFSWAYSSSLYSIVYSRFRISIINVRDPAGDIFNLPSTFLFKVVAIVQETEGGEKPKQVQNTEKGDSCTIS